jgi:hypothetical protein
MTIFRAPVSAIVIPAKAGIHLRLKFQFHKYRARDWIGIIGLNPLEA